MASVFFGRLAGAGGFARTVAIKRLHAPFARDPEFVAMFLDEARLAARIRHPNVVATLDVVATDDDVLLVLEYVHGESFARVQRAAREWRAEPDPRIVRAVLVGALHGLHAAHEAVSEGGEPLGIVHRDVSPQNILVGLDGVARILDFGVAKASQRLQTTRQGQIKGKLAYMAPEQILDGPIDRRIDVYAAGVILWEALAGRRLFHAESDVAVVHKVIHDEIAPPSRYARGVSAELDAIVLRATARDPAQRFATAHEMARALERSGDVATPSEVGAWCEALAGGALARRAQKIRHIESQAASRANDTVSAVGPSDGFAAAGLVSEETGRTHSTSPAVVPSRVAIVRRRSVAALVTALTAACMVGAIAGGVVAFRRYGGPTAKAPSAVSGGGAKAKASPRTASDPTEPCPEGMVRIGGGQFFMGSDDPETRSADRPVHHVLVRPFCMDVTEVTTLAYKACSDRGKCRRAPDSNWWAGLTPRQTSILDPLCNARSPDARARHPINCVSWTAADEYCRAYGKRLPTEAEWELAARGTDGRTYPWGEEPPNGKLLNACGKECAAWAAPTRFEVQAMHDDDDGWATTAPVGSFPAGSSVYGVADIAGNVWEWVADWYAPYTADEAVDPTGPAAGAARVIRGGAWNGADPTWVRPTYRFSAEPEMRSHGIGFRCAR